MVKSICLKTYTKASDIGRLSSKCLFTLVLNNPKLYRLGNTDDGRAFNATRKDAAKRIVRFNEW